MCQLSHQNCSIQCQYHRSLVKYIHNSFYCQLSTWQNSKKVSFHWIANGPDYYCVCTFSRYQDDELCNLSTSLIREREGPWLIMRLIWHECLFIFCSWLLPWMIIVMQNEQQNASVEESIYKFVAPPFAFYTQSDSHQFVSQISLTFQWKPFRFFLGSRHIFNWIRKWCHLL